MHSNSFGILIRLILRHGSFQLQSGTLDSCLLKLIDASRWPVQA
eukprot:jgi/Botrbrau1/20031/Bobra.200_1s0036.1